MVYELFTSLCAQLLPARCLNCGNIASPARALCVDCHQELVMNAVCCRSCALPMQHSGLMCGRCQQQRPYYDEALSTLIYQGISRQLVTGLKFQGKLANAGLLARLFHENLPAIDRPDFLVPIPLHASRLRERGYNQSLEIARVLGKLLDIPVAINLACRRRNTARQAELPRKAKPQNVHNAFEIVASQVPNHIAIVDDVMTSGHTANEFARVLKNAGAGRVQVWAMARAGTPGH